MFLLYSKEVLFYLNILHPQEEYSILCGVLAFRRRRALRLTDTSSLRFISDFSGILRLVTVAPFISIDFCVSREILEHEYSVKLCLYPSSGISFKLRGYQARNFWKHVFPGKWAIRYNRYTAGIRRTYGGHTADIRRHTADIWRMFGGHTVNIRRTYGKHTADIRHYDISVSQQT